MRSSVSLRAVSIRIGTCDSWRRESAKEMPDSPGSMRSSTIRSNVSPSIRRRASAAVSAVVTRKPWPER